MTVIRFPKTQARNAEEAWSAYVRLAKTAQATMRLEDGIAAGKAWSRFLEFFLDEGAGRSA